MSRDVWLGLGVAAFAAGLAAMVAMKRKTKAAPKRGRRQSGMQLQTREAENHKVIHTLVVLTAGTAYLIMASGGGRVRMPDGHELFYMRYIDWAITTPLLLLSLGLTALGSPFRRLGLLLGILFIDAYMILTGFLSDASDRNSAMKWVWYAISSGAFAALYYLLWGPLRDESETTGERSADLYLRHLTFLSTVWAAYPVNFLLGPEGLGVIDTDSSTAVYTVLDITAKVIFGLYSLSDIQERSAEEIARGEVPEHELRPAPDVFHERWDRGPTQSERPAAA